MYDCNKHMQGEVESVCKYTLLGTNGHGFTGGIQSIISLKNDDPLTQNGNITYTLPPNTYFTTNFEVETATGSFIISPVQLFSKFSKPCRETMGSHSLMVCKFYLLQQHLISRNSLSVREMMV